MYKYIEFGFGNSWLIRTEFENCNGTEFEKKGIVGKINFKSFYVRIWILKKVFIWDSEEGYKFKIKSNNKFKFILGVKSFV